MSDSIYPVVPAEPGTVWAGDVAWTQFAATAGAGAGAALGVGFGMKDSPMLSAVIGAVVGAWLGVKYIKPN